MQNSAKPPKLSVRIHDAQFAKDFQYVIGVSFQNQKKQTDISALTKSPLFSNNLLLFDIGSSITVAGSMLVKFTASIALEEDEPTHSRLEQHKTTKVLGECSLNLAPFGIRPSEPYHLPIRQQLKFIRQKDGKQISVGRFLVSLKIVPDAQIDLYTSTVVEKPLEKQDYFVELPDYSEQLDFAWRVKIEVRQANGIQSGNGTQPISKVQVGWTEYRQAPPQTTRIVQTHSLQSNNPEWHQTILILNPPHVVAVTGFLIISMKDVMSFDDILSFAVPLESMTPFTPYNVIATKNQQQSDIELYISLTLQAPLSKSDLLYDVIVADVQIDPVAFRQFCLVLSWGSLKEPEFSFQPFRVDYDSIERILQFSDNSQMGYVMSHVMRAPPVKSSRQYRAACIFTVSAQLIRKRMQLYVAAKKQNSPTFLIAAIADVTQNDLSSLLIECSKKRLFLTARCQPNSRLTKCQIELAAKEDARINLQKNELTNSRFLGDTKPGDKFRTEASQMEGDSIQRFAQQNHEIVNRLLKELEDKSESLRQASAEICDLRSRAKLLQSQNSILKRNSLREEDELSRSLEQQLQPLGPAQLKERVLRLTQLYRGQREKSKELELTVRQLQPQVANLAQLHSSQSSLRNTIQSLSQQIQKLQKEAERIGLYKDTIRKQEKVIVKLQKVLGDGSEQMRQARKMKIQLQELRRKDQSFKSQLSATHQDEISRLQRTIMELQQNSSIRPASKAVQSQLQAEFRLHQAQQRITSLEEELVEKAKTYARELAFLRMKITEKEALIDGYQY